MEHLEGILSRLAQSQEKTQVSQETTQRQVETILETVSALVTKRNKNTQEGESSVTNDTNSDPNQGKVGSGVVDYPELSVFAKTGDWESAKSLFSFDSEAVCAVVTEYSHTALHIAAYSGQWMFFKNLLENMPPEALELQETKNGYTALHTVVVEGNVEVAMAMVDKNRGLTQIPEYNGSVPLKVAVDYVTDRQEEMVRYLLSVTRDEEPSKPFSGPRGSSLLCSLVDANFYDIALIVVQKYPNLGIVQSEKSKVTALEMMAERPFAFLGKCKLTFWQRWIYSVIPVDIPAAPARNHLLRDVNNPVTAVIPVDIPAAPAPNDVENPMPEIIPVDLPDAQANHRLEDSLDTGEIITGFIGTMMKFLSAFKNSFTRVPGGKRMYNKKLMHKLVTALLKCMLTQLGETTGHMEFFETSDVLRKAMKAGTTEFVVECLQTFPELIWHKTNNQRILQVAVEERNHEVFNLICKLSGDHKNDLVSKRDDYGNTILHHVAKLAPSYHLRLVSGAPLQIQREMQWFQVVENLLPERYRLVRNKGGKTARQIFTVEHTHLVKEAEKWMKVTSESCILLSTLIATVTFAAPFTVPGGNKDDTGIPVLTSKNAFRVFAIADVLSLFFSITSVLMFLSILTSRYAEEDFLESLPKKLSMGLLSILFSLSALVIAFVAVLFIVLGHWSLGAPISLAIFACVPVASFVLMQFPLFWEIVRSTYWPDIFTGNIQWPVKQNDKKEN